MRHAAFIALLALGTTLAVFAGNERVSAKNTQNDCCNKTECCPTGCEEECCY